MPVQWQTRELVVRHEPGVHSKICVSYIFMHEVRQVVCACGGSRTSIRLLERSRRRSAWLRSSAAPRAAAVLAPSAFSARSSSTRLLPAPATPPALGAPRLGPAGPLGPPPGVPRRPAGGPGARAAASSAPAQSARSQARSVSRVRACIRLPCCGAMSSGSSARAPALPSGLPLRSWARNEQHNLQRFRHASQHASATCRHLYARRTQQSNMRLKSMIGDCEATARTLFDVFASNGVPKHSSSG